MAGNFPLRGPELSRCLQREGQAARQPATAPPQRQNQSARVAVRPVARAGRNESKLECPARAPSRSSSPAAQVYDRLTLSGKLWFALAQSSGMNARRSRMLREGGPGRAVTSCAGSALTLKERKQYGSLDKNHFVRHKAGRGQTTSGPGGDPARPRRPVYAAQSVLILRAQGAQAAPSRPRLPPLRRGMNMGAGKGNWWVRCRRLRRRSMTFVAFVIKAMRCERSNGPDCF